MYLKTCFTLRLSHHDALYLFRRWSCNLFLQNGKKNLLYYHIQCTSSKEAFGVLSESNFPNFAITTKINWLKFSTKSVNCTSTEQTGSKLTFSCFLCYHDVENHHECHVFVRVVRQVKVSSDWSRCIFVISLNVSKMLAKSLANLLLVSSMYNFLHIVYFIQ